MIGSAQTFNLEITSGESVCSVTVGQFDMGIVFVKKGIMILLLTLKTRHTTVTMVTGLTQKMANSFEPLSLQQV